MKPILAQILVFTLLAAPLALAVPDIRFQGRQSGVWNNIDDGDTNPNQTVTLFGNIDIGDSEDRLYRLRNTGNQTLTVTSFASTSSQFTTVGLNLPLSLAASGEQEFSIRYTPVTAGQRTTTITFRSNDPDAEDPYTFALRGFGLAGEISLAFDPATGNDVGIADGDTTPNTADGTAFGVRRLADGHIDHDFYIRNSSGADAQLTIVNPRLIGSGASQFEIRSLGTSKLGIGNNRNFKIRFNPTSPGPKTATFIVNNNDPDENPFSFAISGTATAFSEIRVRGTRPAEALEEITDGDTSPRQAEGTLFADTDVGSDRTSNFRIHNDGDGLLTLGFPTLNSAHFQVLNFSTADIAPGGSRDFNIRFRPTSSGIKIGAFSFPTNDTSENPFNFSVRGFGEAAEMDLEGSRDGVTFEAITDGDNSPQGSDGTNFGNVPVSANAVERTFRITNSGNKKLNISGRSFGGSGASHFGVSGLFAGNPFVNIDAGDTQTFTISFDPTSAGTKTATFSMDNDDPDENPYNFTITGVGQTFPNIRVRGRQSGAFNDITDGDTNPNDQAVTQFADTDLGSSDTRVYRIVNDGDATLNLTSFASSNPQFTFAGTPNSISANTNNDNGNFDIVFTPTARGTQTATITILSNDPDAESSYTFRVTGTGQGPEIDVAGSPGGGSFIAITDGDTSADPNDGTLFSDTSIGVEDPSQREFVIRNTGDRNLNISGRSFTGSGASHFKVRGLFSSNPFVNIGPGESQIFTIEFDPTSAGAKNATFNIESNDGDESPYTFAVRGVGISEPYVRVEGRNGVLPWKIVWQVVDPENGNGTSFKSQDINGESKTHRFRLANNGDATLNITSITTGKPDFIVSDVPSTIAPGDRDTFDVTFDPTVAERVEDVVLILSNDRNDPWEFNIVGTGKDGSLSRLVADGRDGILAWTRIQNNGSPDDKTGTDFDTQDVDGGSNTNRFRLDNIGGSSLTISSITVDSPHYTLGAIPTTLEAGDRETLDVTFNPSSPGRHDATVRIESDADEGNPFLINITGSGDEASNGPEVEVQGNTSVIEAGDTTPSLIDGTDFGAATGNPSRRFVIRNRGNGTLTIDNLSSSEPENFTAALRDPDRKELESGESTLMEVTFLSPGEGILNSTISFTNNDANGDELFYSFVVSARTNSSRPELDVTGLDGIAIADETTVPDLAAGCGFGTVDVTTDGRPRRFTLTNSGTFDLNIAGVLIDSDQYEVQGFPDLIAPGESGTLNVLFAPDIAEQHDATLSIFSDDLNENPYNFAITGTGTGELDAESRSSAFSAITSGFTFSFPSANRQSYRIVQSTDLVTWTTVQGQTDIQGTGEIISRTLTTLAGGRMYVRAELE